MKRRKHIVEESVDNIIVSQEITYPPASIIHALYYYIVLFRCGGPPPPPRRRGVAAACPALPLGLVVGQAIGGKQSDRVPLFEILLPSTQ